MISTPLANAWLDDSSGADCHDVADKHWINGNLPLDAKSSDAAECDHVSALSPCSP